VVGVFIPGSPFDVPGPDSRVASSAQVAESVCLAALEASGGSRVPVNQMGAQKRRAIRRGWDRGA